MVSVEEMVKKMILNEYERNEYKEFIINENPQIIQQLTELVMHSYSRQKNIRGEIRETDDEMKKEMLKSALHDEKATFNEATRMLSDFILKHQNDSKYIENIISQMPFMNRAAFINEAVLTMLSKKMGGQHVEMTNALDVFERSIDKDVREKLKTTSFEELCKELYMDAGTISNPTGIRSIVLKYDCINFSLYRLDKELGKGIFEQQLGRNLFGINDLSVYQFDRDIYENHEAPNLRDVFNGKDRRRKEWIEDTYWVQKITDEDKERMGVSDYPDLAEKLNYGVSRKNDGIGNATNFTEQEIGKGTIGVSTMRKDKAQDRQQRDEQQIVQEEQKNLID